MLKALFSSLKAVGRYFVGQFDDDHRATERTNLLLKTVIREQETVCIAGRVNDNGAFTVDYCAEPLGG